MTLELKETKSKKRKSYSELLGEYKNLFKKTADVYIPELFDALREEHPDWLKPDYMNRIVKDLDGINTTRTIETFRPNWMKKFTKEKSQKNRQKDQEKDLQREKGLESLRKVKEELPEPEEPEEQETVSSTPLEDWKETHPDIAKSPDQSLGEINRAIARLWRALTEGKDMPTREDDIKRDHIIPTRQYRRDIINASSEVERTFLWNWLIWLNMATDDTLEIIESIGEG